jgi:hypothetical protein
MAGEAFGGFGRQFRKVTFAANPQGFWVRESRETAAVGTFLPGRVLVPHQLFAVTALALTGADKVVGKRRACVAQAADFLGRDGRGKKTEKSNKQR